MVGKQIVENYVHGFCVKFPHLDVFLLLLRRPSFKVQRLSTVLLWPLQLPDLHLRLLLNLRHLVVGHLVVLQLVGLVEAGAVQRLLLLLLLLLVQESLRVVQVLF